MSRDFLFTEKYRPAKIADTILPPNLKAGFQAMVDSGEIPNMLLSGTAGSGKTTVARALCDELDLDYIVVNGSEEGNIDTLRGKIKQFASSVSLQGGYKVVILDEADYLNPQSTQPALRGFIEQFSDNCRFILTCNLKNRIIEPLHSRCGVYEFNTARKELGPLCAGFMKRLEWILGEEGISYDRSVIANMIQTHAPDWRRVIVEVQRHAQSGLDDMTAITNNSGSYDVLFLHLKSKQFVKMREWVVNNIDIDSRAIFRGIYDSMSGSIHPQSIPQVVLILADYSYKASFVADAELNTVACLTEIMMAAEFT